MATILALDLGKFKSVALWYDSVTHAERFETIRSTRAEVQQLLERQPADLVVIEACTSAGWVHDLCRECGRQVLVANTNGEAWKFKNVKRKTDRDDARKLAQLAALGQLPAVTLPERPTRQKRSLLGYRQRLVSRRTAVQNRIRALLLSQGEELPLGHRAWTEKGLSLLDQFARPLADCGAEELWRGELHLLLQEYTHLIVLLNQVEVKLEQLNRADPRVRLLETIPGVGPRTAETVAVYLPDAGRFTKGSQVSAYAGLVPRQYQSGLIDRKGRINKRGPALLRKMLVECAWVMLRYNEWARQVVARLSKGQKTRRKQAVVALARKLLVRCWAMLRDNQPWREPLTDDLPRPTAVVVT